MDTTSFGENDHQRESIPEPSVSSTACQHPFVAYQHVYLCPGLTQAIFRQPWTPYIETSRSITPRLRWAVMSSTATKSPDSSATVVRSSIALQRRPIWGLVGEIRMHLQASRGMLKSCFNSWSHEAFFGSSF